MGTSKLRVLKKPFVAWVCDSCGTKHGNWYQGGEYTGPKHHCATYHYGSCDVCGAKDIPVTEPRDYGYLREATP